MSRDPEEEIRFLTDRMLGPLCRYLRFMGYDTMSANSRSPGNTREDTELLKISRKERRLLLTRDQELASRAGTGGLLVRSEDLDDQVRQLAGLRLIRPTLKLTRCSRCNAFLAPATNDEVMRAEYAPSEKAGLAFFTCPSCNRLYWYGSHTRHLQERVGKFSDLPHKG